MATRYVGYGSGPGGGFGYPGMSGYVPVVKPRQQIGSSVNPGAAVVGGTGGSSGGLSGAIGSPHSAFNQPVGDTTTTTTMTPRQIYQSDILSDPGSIAAQ